VGVEVGPRRDHAGARHQPEGRLHPHNAGELRRDAVGPTVVGAERREGHPVRDGDRRARAGPAGRTGAGGIVGVQHLSGAAAGAVAVVGEVVGGGLPEDDRPGRAEPRHLERVAPHGVGEEPGPLGVGAGSREPLHVVDRLGEDGDPVEGPVQPAGAQTGVGGARLGERRVGERVDRAPPHSLGTAAIERLGGDLGRGPRAATAAGLVVRDGAVERVLPGWDPGRKRQDDEGGELGQDFASSRRHVRDRGAGAVAKRRGRAGDRSGDASFGRGTGHDQL
jgi:hypothetical protein